MSQRATLVLICLLVCLGSLSCQKLPPSEAQRGQLKVEMLKTLDAIPMDYGNLVAVTSDSAYADWAQLWFERADKTIVVVKVNWAQGVIQKGVTIVPRR